MNFRFELSTWSKDNEKKEEIWRLIIKDDHSKNTFFMAKQELLVLREILNL